MPLNPVVIPSSFQTNRADLNAALAALIASFQANVAPNVVRKMVTELPASLTGEHPFVYIGTVTEEIHHDASTRATIFRGTIGYVDRLTVPAETNDRVNVFADYMRDMFTANASLMINGILEETGFDDSGELTQGNVHMTNALLHFTYSILEGRN